MIDPKLARRLAGIECTRLQMVEAGAAAAEAAMAVSRFALALEDAKLDTAKVSADDVTSR